MKIKTLLWLLAFLVTSNIFAKTRTEQTVLKTSEKQKSEENATTNVEELEPKKPETQTRPNSKIERIHIESLATRVRIEIEASAGLAALSQEILSHPGRLIFEIPDSIDATSNPPSNWTDGLIIPRIRLAQHQNRVQLIIDTVLETFPHFEIQKTDEKIVIVFEKTPEMVIEAQGKASLFTKLQKDDRESFLRVGSEDEGGIIAALNSSTSSEPSQNLKTIAQTDPKQKTPIQIKSSANGQNRVILLLEGQKEYQFVIHDSGAPIHIERVRTSAKTSSDIPSQK